MRPATYCICGHSEYDHVYPSDKCSIGGCDCLSYVPEDDNADDDDYEFLTLDELAEGLESYAAPLLAGKRKKRTRS